MTCNNQVKPGGVAAYLKHLYMQCLCFLVRTVLPLTTNQIVSHAVKHTEKPWQSFPQQASSPICHPPCQQTNQTPTLARQVSCQDVTKWNNHTPTRLSSQPANSHTHYSRCQPASQSFSHTESMLHFHLMRCVEVKNGQSQRHEISHLTLPCSLSNTHYFVLSESFSLSVCPLSFCQK